MATSEGVMLGVTTFRGAARVFFVVSVCFRVGTILFPGTQSVYMWRSGHVLLEPASNPLLSSSSYLTSRMPFSL